MKFKILPGAVRDLKEIRDYTAADDSVAAAQVVERIIKSFDLLSARPDIGRPMAGKPIRVWSIPGLPYVVAYRVSAQIYILRVYHTRRKLPPEW